MGQSQSLEPKRTYLAWMVVASLALCPLIYLEGIRDAGDLGKRALLYGCGGLLLIVSLFQGLRDNSEESQIKVPFLVFSLLLMAFISGMWWLFGTVPVAAEREFSGWIVSSIWLLLAFRLRQHVILLYLGILSCALVIAVIGILQAYDLISLYEQVAPPAATFINRNFASHVVVLGLPALLVLCIILGGSLIRLRVLLVLVGFILPIYLVYTTSRNALLASTLAIFAGSVLVSILALKRTDWFVSKRLGLFLIPLIFGFATGWLTQPYTEVHTGASLKGKLSNAAEYISERSEIDELSNVERAPLDVADSSAYGRSVFYRNSLSIVKEHWLTGLGAGQFSLNYPLYQGEIHKNAADAHLKFLHNDYLEFLVEHGLFGLVFLLVCGLLIGRQLWYCFKSESTELQLAAIGCISALVALAVLTSFSAPFWMPVVPILMMVYLGAAHGFDSNKGLIHCQFLKDRGSVSLICVVLLSFTLWKTYGFAKDYRGLRSYAEFRQFDGQHDKESFELAEALALEVRRFSPEFWESEFHLALHYTARRKIDLAIDALDRSLDVFPYNYRALCNRSNLLEQRQQFNAARADVELALQISEHDPALWMSGLRLGLATNDNTFALECAAQLTSWDPEQLQLQLAVADLKGRVEGPVAASDYLEMQANPIRTHKHALYLLAKYNMLAGRKAKAREYLAKLRRVAPNYPVEFSL